MDEATDFAKWMKAMGYNGKQITKAGRDIGLHSQTIILESYHGKREITDVERLAMAAVRAGLPAWTPETDKVIAAAGGVFAALDGALKKEEQELV